MKMHVEMTFTCVLLKTKVNKLVICVHCACWEGGVRERGFGEIGLSNIQKIFRKTMGFLKSSLTWEQWNPGWN